MLSRDRENISCSISRSVIEARPNRLHRRSRVRSIGHRLEKKIGHLLACSPHLVTGVRQVRSFAIKWMDFSRASPQDSYPPKPAYLLPTLLNLGLFNIQHNHAYLPISLDHLFPQLWGKFISHLALGSPTVLTFWVTPAIQNTSSSSLNSHKGSVASFDSNTDTLYSSPLVRLFFELHYSTTEPILTTALIPLSY